MCGTGWHADEREAEADRFAADFLIPPEDWTHFAAFEAPGRASIEAFASQMGVATGIVVGRLQHEKIIPHNRLNELRDRLEYAPGP